MFAMDVCHLIWLSKYIDENRQITISYINVLFFLISRKIQENPSVLQFTNINYRVALPKSVIQIG